MKLISLTSNKASFHPVQFKDGVNIILGKQACPIKVNNGKTYNGVGKSFIIYLIHFCLGAGNSSSSIQKLSGWTFSLTFSIDNKEYLTTRSVDKINKIVFRGEEVSIKEFHEVMLDICFNIKTENKPLYMTWTTLLSRFIRKEKSCYMDFDSFVQKESDYSKVLNNGYLIGINHHLIIKKMDLRDQHDLAKKREKAIKEDPIFRKYYLKENEVDIDSTELMFLSIQNGSKF